MADSEKEEEKELRRTLGVLSQERRWRLLTKGGPTRGGAGPGMVRRRLNQEPNESGCGLRRPEKGRLGLESRHRPTGPKEKLQA